MHLHRHPVLVWLTGLAAYLVSVMHRTSFGVAGLEAAERFSVSPAVLSSFVVLQLLVYAILQVPVGMLLDRYGARRLVVVGGLTMATGQLLLAVATSLPAAIVARVLVGTGDAMTFISVLSVVRVWFSPRRVPLMTQLTGLLGQLGQVLSAVPLAALLHGAGWPVAFVSAAATGAVVTIAVLVVVRDHPPHAEFSQRSVDPRQVLTGLRKAWSEPGTRMGMWTHMGALSSGNVFVLMWGVPYLIVGQGLSPSAASALLTVFVAVGIATGPIFGEFTARYPARRSWLVIAVITAAAVAWSVVLVIPSPAPYWLLVLLIVVLAIGGPGSMVGFDFARTFNPDHRQGTAVGIVNMGGFIGSLAVILAVGVVLDVAGSGTYSSDAFRMAWAVQYPVWVVSLAGILGARRRARRKCAAIAVLSPRPVDEPEAGRWPDESRRAS